MCRHRRVPAGSGCRPPAGPPRYARAASRNSWPRALPACAAGRCRCCSGCVPGPDAPSAGAAPAARRAREGAANAPPRSRCAHPPLLPVSTRPARPCVTAPCRAPSAQLPDGGPGAAGWAPVAAPPAAQPRHATAAPPACPDRPSWPLPRLRWCRRRVHAPGTGPGSAACSGAPQAALHAASASACPTGCVSADRECARPAWSGSSHRTRCGRRAAAGRWPAGSPAG